jgi:hypothetical protein
MDAKTIEAAHALFMPTAALHFTNASQRRDGGLRPWSIPASDSVGISPTGNRDRIDRASLKKQK